MNFTGSVSADSGYDANWTIIDQATDQVVASGPGTSFGFTPGQNPDSYTATLTVTDVYGQTGSASTSISVADTAPIVSLSADQPSQTTGSVGTVNFTGSVSADSSYTATWSVVDENSQQVVASGSGANFSFTPGQDPNSYVATLTAGDAYGLIGSASSTIVVAPPVGPGITAIGTNGATDGSTDGTITFTADTSGTNGGTTTENYTYNDVLGVQQTYSVTLGNGATSTFDVSYNPAAGGALQTITIDGGARDSLRRPRSW